MAKEANQLGYLGRWGTSIVEDASNCPADSLKHICNQPWCSFISSVWRWTRPPVHPFFVERGVPKTFSAQQMYFNLFL